ncbi:MAG: PadR family transcriptional regulator [Defluviitaleaceae bacterium]|nr:PadR family transcriptional regulator [Defluviitaleaceae bacterium]
MSLKHGLLGLLSLSPQTGYELSKEFALTMKYIWHTKTTQIYTELNSMEQKGWLVSERVIQDDKPNKKIYTITEAGTAEFLNWLLEPGEDIENALAGRSAFLLRVLFSGNTSADAAIALMESFRETCLGLGNAHKGIRSAIDQDADEVGAEHTLYFNIVARHGEMILKTRLEWIEETIQTIKNHHNIK